MDFKLSMNSKRTHASWEMKHFIALVNHDNGTLRLKVSASSRDAAYSMIMLCENCPKRAIKLYPYNPGGPDAKINPKGMGKNK